MKRIQGRYPRTLYQLGMGERLSCGTEDIDAGSEVPWHTHETAEEVLFCTAGSGTIHVGETASPFLPGIMVLVPKTVPHRIVNNSKVAVLSLTWTLSPPQAPAQFQAGAKHSANEAAWFPRVMPWLFVKKQGDELARATPAVNEMYGDGTPMGPGRAQTSGHLLHLSYHALPQKGPSLHLRQLSLAALMLSWLCLVPMSMKMRCVLGACAYSSAEWLFTLLERGRGYTSIAQFASNLIYLPVLLDGYSYLLLSRPVLYIALFPVNVWLLEIVVGQALTWLYGHNVAWCYADYADAYCAASFRIGHAPFWVGLGAICWVTFQPLVTVTSGAATLLGGS